MAINSISDIYSWLYTSALNNTSNLTSSTETSDSSSDSNLTDILELGSSEADLSAYLNYNSSGSYSSMPSLIDYLSEEEDNSSSVIDALYSNSSADSALGIVDSIIEGKSEEIDNLIASALEKLDNTVTED